MTTVGILGAGQLGRMLALAGYPLGMRFVAYDEAPEAPAGHLLDLTVAGWDDDSAIDAFGSSCTLATYEFENVPVAAVRRLAARIPVFPSPQALETAQDRLSEKTLFRSLGIETAPFAPVDTLPELEDALRAIGLPAMLKTRRMGYDGKGQRLLQEVSDARRAFEALGARNLILEGFVSFERELSILAARSTRGETVVWPLVENVHRDGILRLSTAPAADEGGTLLASAARIVSAVLEALDYAGVLAIELFDRGGRLLANEMAPRVHNSGHWTIEGSTTSQFENHLRAIAGWPLGSTETAGCAAMVNLVGEIPDPERVLEIPGAHLHLYGKSPRPGRKLGHVTLVKPDRAALAAAVSRLAGVVREQALQR